MKLKTIFMMSCLMVMGVVVTNSAFGLPQFKKAFDLRYVKPAGNQGMKAAFKKQSCNTCHIKGKKKNVNNPYGEELGKLIPGNAKKRIKAAKTMGGKPAQKAEKDKVLKELEAAFDAVEKMKDAKGEIYGEKIKAGKLPN